MAGRANPTRVSQPDFFKVCNYLQSNRDKIIEARPTEVELIKLVEEGCGVKCPTSTIGTAKETVGLVYQRRNNNRKGQRLKRRPGIYLTTIAKCLAKVITDLNGEGAVPAELREVIERGSQD